MKTVGVVLAGGRSRRFGRNKLLEPVGGQPMVLGVVGLVESVVGEVYLSVAGAGDQLDVGDLEIPIIEDRMRRMGPLGGLCSAFQVVDADWVLVVAGDMPKLTSGSLDMLLRRRAADVGAVVGQDFDGRPQPLVACYHRSVAPMIDACIADGAFAMNDLLSRIRNIAYVTLPANELINVNLPDDLPE